MTHPTFETFVAYFAGDHPNEALIEEHLFACDACTREAERVAYVTETLRAEIPPIIDTARLAALRARGIRIVENTLNPGDCVTLAFPRDVDVLLHRLGGIDLTRASSVGVRVFVDSSGRTLVEQAEARFDRDAGAVLIACQHHFAVFPPDIGFEVTVRGDGAERVERYTILHEFA